MHLIKAPIAGKVSMSKVWSTQQFVQQGMEVFTLVPKGGVGDIIVKAIMPPKGLGKIKIGMPANLKLDGYPQVEYGILKAELQHISLLPESIANNQISYQITLTLKNGLMTSYNKEIPFRQEMPGMAEIITEEKRIIHRVLDHVLDVFKNR